VSKTTAAENDLARWIFTKVTPAWATDNTSLYLALHFADPGEDGAQNTSEVSYTGYARLPVPRNTSGWTVADGVITNAAELLFGTCTAGSATATHMSIGTAATGAGKVLYYGPLNSSLPISNGVTPRFAAGALAVNDE